MATDRQRPPGEKPDPPSDAAASAARRGADRPFDLWLQKQLHAMYDEIASEPLPSDLLNLIDRDAGQDGSEGGDAPPPRRPPRKP